jgi:hypothetical protein
LNSLTTPAGWPSSVRPPGAPDWEQTAVVWLLDLCPTEYRRYEVLRRHPLVLARFAAWHVAGAREAARRGLERIRTDLRDLVSPETVSAAVAAMEREGARLVRVAREVDLVERALRGQRFVPRL